jgi:hypothetical protein
MTMGLGQDTCSHNKKKKSIIIWQMRHVKGGGIWLTTFIVVCLLQQLETTMLLET